MILIVLGTQKFQCNRLLILIDNLIQENKLKEEVFAQIGNSDYIPRNYNYKRFLNKDEFEKKILECDMIITHGGVGTIISAITKRKPTIIFPRLKKYNEHVDDHQLEIAEAFSRRNYAKVCKENTDIKKLIDECRVCKFSNYESKREDIINEILRFISLDS